MRAPEVWLAHDAAVGTQGGSQRAMEPPREIWRTPPEGLRPCSHPSQGLLLCQEDSAASSCVHSPTGPSSLPAACVKTPVNRTGSEEA